MEAPPETPVTPGQGHVTHTQTNGNAAHTEAHSEDAARMQNANRSAQYTQLKTSFVHVKGLLTSG